MKIGPFYATFEQCKLLKLKGYDQTPTKLSEPYYSWDGKLNGDVVEYVKAFIKKDQALMEKYENIRAVEQWHVVEWLRINHGIWISVNPDNDNKFQYVIYGMCECSEHSYDSPQEAYLAAFDYLLTKI